MLRLLACAAVVCGVSATLTPAPTDLTHPNKVVGHHDDKLSKSSAVYHDSLAFPFKTAFKPAYENVTFSFYGVCGNIDVCFPYGRSQGVDGAGTFNRDAFRRWLAAAYNTRVFAERRKLIETISRESPEAVEEIEATQSLVKRYILEIENDDIYTLNRETRERFFFDRVMEINDPRDFAKVETKEGYPVVAEDQWNIFVRVTIRDVPTELASNVRSLMLELERLAQSQDDAQLAINWNSLWIENDAAFITDKISPVLGRGKKSERLLIPLMLGVVSMLAIPIIVSALLVTSQKRKAAAERRCANRERQIEAHRQVLLEKKALIATFEEREVERAEEIELQQVHQKEEDATELTNRTVDWIKSE